jgi:hypothetical protein
MPENPPADLVSHFHLPESFMSLETTDAPLPSSGPPNGRGACQDRVAEGASRVDRTQWDSLKSLIRQRTTKRALREVFGDSVRTGSVYRWGVAAARGECCDAQLQWLSRIACGARKSKTTKVLDCQAAAESAIHKLTSSRSLSPLDCADAISWAAALPELTRHLNQQTWWDLLGCLQDLRESLMQRNATDTPPHLMIGAELGLTLAWRLADVPSCKRLQKSSLDAFAAWCECDDESVSSAIAGATDARLVLASLFRCQQLIRATTRRKMKKQQRSVGNCLATWVAALTTTTGGTAMSAASRQDLIDDLPPHGLLARATEFDPEALKPATAAALGKSQSGGRLAWEVCLPEAFHHDEDANVAVMFPDWDVRRGRIHLDYAEPDNRLELLAGRAAVISGRCQTMIEFDGAAQQSCGPWTSSCEYTDDDVHYLELEQPWTGGILLQRQWMIVRDDRCVLFSDSIVPKDSAASHQGAEIRYDCRFPLAPSITVDPEPETRDLLLCDGKRRGLVMPLSASEWRLGASSATLKATDDGHLVLSARGSHRLNIPLWFDFQQRRFNRKRTWRQLTVADELRIAEPSEAVGYRVQVGSQQWMVYRSLGATACRSVLGKHLVADFFSARFDPSDGSLEELVTVDVNDLIDD